MLIISAVNEQTELEKRVALSPDTAKRFIALGANVRIETGAGAAAGYADAEYAKAGAQVCASDRECLAQASMLLTVGPLADARLEQLASGTIMIGTLSPYQHAERLRHYAAKGISAFAMELLPRISRAQAMDVLSSQANLAGYRAVIEAVAAIGKATPMMMTAAGTVAPAKVLVIGAGVAGLQAIATAKRLGCTVQAFDVRPVVKEQVESLGAKFVEVPAAAGESAETSGGYAREMSEEYKAKQAVLLQETLAKVDIAITTALIPGKPAPVLITESMVQGMKAGSVIVDMAVANGGNCPLSKPDALVQTQNGVNILGFTNLPSRVAADASSLYARNLYQFAALMVAKGEISIPQDDELIKGTLLTQGGAIVHPSFSGGA